MNKEDYKVYSDKMRKSIDAVNADFASVRAGRANASVLDRISVDYYGSPTPIQQIAAIASPDPRQLVITPWDGTALKPIERAIQESDLGINPQNDGKSIRLNFPQLTEERRKELVKQIHKYSENGKVAIRNIRRDAMEEKAEGQRDHRGRPEGRRKGPAEADRRHVQRGRCPSREEREGAHGGLIWGSFPKRTRQGRLI